MGGPASIEDRSLGVAHDVGHGLAAEDPNAQVVLRESVVHRSSRLGGRQDLEQHVVHLGECLYIDAAVGDAPTGIPVSSSSPNNGTTMVGSLAISL